MNKQQMRIVIALLTLMGSAQGIPGLESLVSEDGLERMMNGIRQHTEAIQADQNEIARRIASLEGKSRLDPAEQSELVQLKKQAAALDKVGGAVQDVGLGVFRAAGSFVEGQIQKEQKKADREAKKQEAVGIAYVQAEQDKRARTEIVQAYLNFFSNRKNITLLASGVGLAAVGVYGAKEGSKVLFHYIDSLLGKPQLVRDSSVDSYWRTLKDTTLRKQKPAAKLADVIVAPQLKEKLQTIALATKTARAHNEPFMNALFYGPPGVGKTMYAKELAKFADMEYAVMSGADFSQFKEGEDITQLHGLFDWAEHSKKGLIVFIDEADSFLRKRTDANQKSINLTNAFLSRVEKQTSDKVMFVFATNHPDVLDSAILSRIAPANRVEFVLPGADERARIFDLYLKKYVLDKGLTLEAGLESNKHNLVAMMDTLTGRDIEGVVTQMARNARLLGKEALVYGMAEDLVKVTVMEKNKENASYKQ